MVAKRTKPITDGTMTLLHMPSRRIACDGDAVISFRGVHMTLTGGRSPHTPNSSGRVWVNVDGHQSTYFPSVVNCEWVQL